MGSIRGQGSGTHDNKGPAKRRRIMVYAGLRNVLVDGKVLIWLLNRSMWEDVDGVVGERRAGLGETRRFDDKWPPSLDADGTTQDILDLAALR